ncbi:MAG: molecular chaperone DnaJ [Chloroflexi bacterium RIFCSPLOWO2_12_FULL_71_12]|nr:MAG: molecular chaperone DnaJ [Chloroflexi bacterium GWC2_70_10]OGO70553.1 MAG: molecular chaperone DnaJ [Chloroflexi bacterium RIFCSPLOWO2_02_FULL_71_16]OGO73560.1 MAG: molecular chaperone DnaJ [Chloroflexi bacterium RIFCSPLOWO2_12_FULL_71_12]
MAKTDHYGVLGVARGASVEDIRGAYRKLARQYHPDVNASPDAAQRFKEVTQAYEILSDPEKRQRYDMFGNGEFGDAAGFGIDDLFNTFFGGARRRERGPVRGADLRLQVELDLEEAVRGVEKTVVVPRQETCAHCGGGGAEPGSKTSTCGTCGGRGEVRQVQQSLFGRFVTVGTCPRCGGAGRTVDQPCKECRGEGRIQAERKVRVNIPAGIDDGQQLRVSAEGESGMRGGPPGDLYVLIRLRDHKLFRREGDDLIHILRVTPAQAALGDEVAVPTIDGPLAKVKIPAGSQHGQAVRVRGKGAPRVHASGRGDQLVYLDVVIPRSLSKEERALYQKLRSVSGVGEEDEGADVLGRIKDALGGS